MISSFMRIVGRILLALLLIALGAAAGALACLIGILAGELTLKVTGSPLFATGALLAVLIGLASVTQWLAAKTKV